MARLIHLNGAPGVGKSALARRYLDDQPLAMLLDIDQIRSALGRWEVVEESRLVARKLAVKIAEAHLRDGHDVVIPQYAGRPAFVSTLEDVARRCEARFFEVVLEAPATVSADRFRSRRAELLGRGEDHPQVDVPDAAVQIVVEDACRALEELSAARSDVVLIRADRPLEDTYEALRTVVGEP